MGGCWFWTRRTSRLSAADDIVEEWFIDKHLYHFSQRTLSRMVEASGFSILECPDPADSANLFLVARKNETAYDFVPNNSLESRRRAESDRALYRRALA